MIVDNIGFRFSDYNTFLCENFCYVNFFKIQGLVTIVCYKYVAKNTSKNFPQIYDMRQLQYCINWDSRLGIDPKKKITLEKMLQLLWTWLMLLFTEHVY